MTCHHYAKVSKWLWYKQMAMVQAKSKPKHTRQLDNLRPAAGDCWQSAQVMQDLTAVDLVVLEHTLVTTWRGDL